MFSIILANAGLWLNLAIPFGFAAYLFYTNREYVAKEFGIQMGATLAFLLVAYFSLFGLTTDLIDSEQHNGHVTMALYEEEYEEEYDCSYESCSGSGKNEVCVTIPQTCYRDVGPYYNIYTSNGDRVGISRSNFFKYKSEFGAKEFEVYHSDQTTSSKYAGEGDEWKSYPDKIIPSAVTHSYENYVVAANKNVINVKTTKEEIDFYKKNGSLKEYPGKYSDAYGTPKLSRIIDTTGKANTRELLKLLDFSSDRIGKAKQANPIIYITDKGPEFKYILEAYWKNAKKNDIILILGIDTITNKVDWSDGIAWTDNTDFLIDLQNQFTEKDIKDSEAIVNSFEGLIQLEYKRKPMKDFEYLKENISLDFKWQALIFILNLIGSFFLFRFMLKN